jgi:hypothetical protein
MENKQVKYTFGGMNMDTSRSKHSFKYYYDAEHIRILATDTQSTGSITNEKGNKLVITIPSVNINIDTKKISWLNPNGTTSILTYTSTEVDALPIFSDRQKIIGTVSTRTGIVIFTSDSVGMDCIWEVDNVLNNSYVLNLLYVRNLGLSISNPIQAVFNYENEKIEKIYWVDGVNQMRLLNLNHSIANGDLEELIDISENTINFVGNFDLSEPTIDSIVYGGNHTSGKIQYTYNLYRVNGAQTTLSPITDLIPLDRGSGLGGGTVNEVVGATPIVKVENLDPEYTHIKLYSIKYTSYNQEPDISLIADREINSSNSLTYFDDGEIIEALTLAEFTFLGAPPLIPRHIEVKDNRLFSANVRENNFDVDIDCRAFSFLDSTDDAYILNDLYANSGTQPGLPQGTSGVWGTIAQVPENFDVTAKADAVNPNYDAYRYQKNSSIEGGTGKYITYSTLPFAIPPEEVDSARVFKDREVYRIGVQFYNKIGQVSFPKWIADFKAGVNNLNGSYNTLRVNLTDEFFVWLNNSSNFDSDNDKPVGFNVIRADRTINDRTILYQGTISPMLFQVKGDPAQTYEDFTFDPGREVWQDNQSVKIPSWAMRNFDHTMRLQPEISGNQPSFGRVLAASHLAWLNDTNDAANADARDGGEITTSTQRAGKLSQTFMFTKMMQLHSPDILFDFGNVKSGLQLRVNGVIEQKEEFIETQETFFLSDTQKSGGKLQFYPLPRTIIENDDLANSFSTPDSDVNPRYIGPSGADDTTDVFQMYRSYETFYENTNPVLYDIYGTPEITEEGQGDTPYNGDDRYIYRNSLTNWLSDGTSPCDTCNSLTSMNTNGIKTLTFMLGNKTQITSSRIGMEELYASTIASNTTDQVVLSVDIVIPNINIYLGNLYGGSSFEDKKRNTYIQVGEYKTVSLDTNFITSPGDTYVNNYKFMRLGKTSADTISNTTVQATEIVSFPVETSVDLKNRSDLSLFAWDNTFQPEFDTYHEYNRVYSQSANLILNTGEGSLFEEINQFDTRLYSSKLKIPGELIDSWTDLLINESMDLDGKYGPINALVSYKDELFTFQDEAIAMLSISPRVQVQGSDGIGMELGTGSVFYDYKYITTNSGSINKWGVLPTKKGIYYYDALNKSVGMVPTYTDTFLSDAKGMHTLFNKNHNFNTLSVDNPLLGKGAVLGYDNYNNDVYITLSQNNEEESEINFKDLSFTVVYNELMGEFIDKKKYIPNNYINKGNKCLLTNGDNTAIYEQFAGEYNEYFDVKQSSFITLMVNPESDYACVFNNVLFNSELYIDDIDQPEKTLTHIHAYSEYQDSGRVPLVLGRNKNLQRKFREWKAFIPREGRERMRNTWIFLKLELDNTDNGKLVLHDIIINYSK